MKAFKLSNPQIIYFKNLERIPGEQELSNLKNEIMAAGGKIGPREDAALADIYGCELNGMNFDIVFDGEEATIYAPETKTIDYLMRMFV